jgi:hypothetical protein
MATTGKPSKRPPKAYLLLKAARCYECDTAQAAGSLVKLQDNKDEREVLCRSCAGLKDWAVLPAGNAAATRLGAKYCADHYVVVRWSELWKCYERYGLLVQPGILERIEAELGVKLPALG